MAYLTSPLCLPLSVLDLRVNRKAGWPSTEHRDTSTDAHRPWPRPPFQTRSPSYRPRLGPRLWRHRSSFSRERHSLRAASLRAAARWRALVWGKDRREVRGLERGALWSSIVHG